jgi:hypothetical protein
LIPGSTSFPQELLVPIDSTCSDAQRPSFTRHLTLSLALAVTVAAGSASALAMGDGDAPAAPAKPATKATDAAANTDDKGMSDAKSETPAATTEDAKVKNDSLIADFVHYVLIDRPDLARTMGQTLLDRKIDPREFVTMVNRGVGERRFTQATNRAQARPDLESVASGLQALYQGGRLAAARNPDAIAENIKLLSGSMSERSFARERLLAAREYAVPQLFSTLLDRSNVERSAQVRSVLVELGRYSIIPLVTALPHLQPVEQEMVASILGDMGQQTASLPFLYELAATTPNPNVKNAAETAIRRISGVVNTQGSIADRYSDLADAYYKGSPSLMSFDGEPNQLTWSYQPGAGLVFGAVDTRVWPQAMAMMLSEKALQADPSSRRAVATWIAANFSRELNTPEGYDNPAYGKDRREPMYYAVAAGSAANQAVLAKALDAGDTRLARRALQAIEKTVGGQGLWSGTNELGGRKPLLEALRYPNRRVQYDAALALGASQPREAFDGSDQIVRILSGAIRDIDTKYAVVIASSPEQQSSLSGLLKDQGFTVLPAAARLDDVRQSVAEAAGVDLIVVSLPSESTSALIADAQSDARLRATPVLALVSMQGYVEQAPRFGRDPRVRIAREGLAPAEIAASAKSLMESSSGGTIAGDEATQYKDRALGVLRDLAVGHNPVLNVSDAQAPLVAALNDAKGDVKFKIAEVLSYIDSERAQRTLFDVTMSADGTDRLTLLNALAGSAKRFGNKLDKRQVDALVELTNTANGDEATAAASVMGALNLSGTNIVPLITGKAPMSEKK